MRRIFLLGILLQLLFVVQPVQARVFSFNESWMAAYLRGSGGLSNISDDAYADSTGSNTDFEREVDYNFSGELGLALLLGERLTLRLGVEGLKAQSVKTQGYLVSTPTDKVDIESDVLSFSPMASIELSYLNLGAMRFYSFGGVGYPTVKVTNDVTLSAGAKTYYGYVGGAYKETWEADPTLTYQLGLGFEYYTMDNLTISMDVGWRILHLKEFTYRENVTVVRGAGTTNAVKGQVVRDDGGHPIDLDFGGMFVGLMFKFYIPQL